MSIILRPNEQLIKIARRHVIFLMPAFFSWPLLILAVLVLRYVLDFNFWGYWLLVLTLVIVIVLLVVLHRFYIWRSNALIITNQRVVENEQFGFFSKTVTELLYRDIREISYSKDGINASVYDYGDLKMRTAGDSDVVVEKIAQPDEVVDLINQIRQGNTSPAGDEND